MKPNIKTIPIRKIFKYSLANGTNSSGRFIRKKTSSLKKSPNIATVGVGESTIGKIRQWTSLLGIKDEEFIPYTDASYKLSIKFTDFYKKGESDEFTHWLLK